MVLLCLVLIAPIPTAQDSLSEQIVACGTSRLGERVGDGQCTGLVVEALKVAGAKLPGRAGEAAWGEPVDAASEIRPGDVIVFTDAVFIRKRASASGAVRTTTATMEHHVAIVSGVQGRPGSLRFAVLHQNAGPTKGDDERRQVVQRWVLDPSELRGGTVRAYRPVPDAPPTPCPLPE